MCLKLQGFGAFVNKVGIFICLEQVGLRDPAQWFSYMLVLKHFSFFS